MRRTRRSLQTLATVLVSLLSPPVLADILVSDPEADTISRFRETNAAFFGLFASGAPLDEPAAIEFGPDGNLYVADFGDVLRYDPNGNLLGVFATGGGLVSASDIEFGPDGALYVLDIDTLAVFRYDGTTGAFIDQFADLSALTGPFWMEFGPADDRLYVSDPLDMRVVRYDGTTGVFVDTFISGGALFLPSGIAFGPDGNFYLADTFAANVKRYDGTTGAFIDVFASGNIGFPQQIAFGPDANLYVVNLTSQTVTRYDGTSGAFLDFAASGNGLSSPVALAFVPPRTVPALPPPAAGILLVLGAGATFLAVRRGERPAWGEVQARPLG